MPRLRLRGCLLFDVYLNRDNYGLDIFTQSRELSGISSDHSSWSLLVCPSGRSGDRRINHRPHAGRRLGDAPPTEILGGHPLAPVSAVSLAIVSFASQS